MPQVWTPDELRSITGGRWLRPLRGQSIQPRGWRIDSRTIEPGDVFLAFPGRNVDGHNFLDDAARRGAGLAIVERPVAPASDPANGMGVLHVDSTQDALTAIAGQWRTRLDPRPIRIIAVTGSNGKTTQRNLIDGVLASAKSGRQAQGSFNNHLGVPLTLLLAQPEDDYLVVELGMNHPGEIAALAGWVRPHIGVITSIGSAHLGLMGSLDAIAREKSSLLDHLAPHPETGHALALLPRSQRRPWVGRTYPQWLVTETTPQPFNFQSTAEGTSVVIDEAPFEAALHGDFIADYIWNAWRIGRELGLETAKIAEAVRAIRPMAMRMEIRRIPWKNGHVEMILDCYNASPDSMRKALALLATRGDHDLEPGGGDGADRRVTGRRIAVLGDMLELEAFSEREHIELGRLAAEAKLDILITVGQASRATGHHAAACARKLGRRLAAEHHRTLDEHVPGGILDRLSAGDRILIKGSRGMKLERLATAMEARSAALGRTEADQPKSGTRSSPRGHMDVEGESCFTS
ncbi:MAG: UDP-N-acetylmuramoyl-tripeptide--D-alanyl-D-alanine ligase [Phycisphaeraceae bacterium]|nr:UDP-N-acetylmuramoyl-tripeptide--D-alanyl-D-alanine ligase [Phycisphaeraceae bacterium]